MSLMSSAASSAEFVVLSTISAKEALLELVPEFEHASGHKVNITYGGGSELSKQISGGRQADIFIGPEEFSGPLIQQGKLQADSRVAFARSTTGLAVRVGLPKPDISTPDKLKAALLAAGKVSYSAGASGMHFVNVLKKLGIEDAVAAKRVTPKPGELVGAVVALRRRRHCRATNQRTAAGTRHTNTRPTAANAATNHRLRRKHVCAIHTARSRSGLREILALAGSADGAAGQRFRSFVTVTIRPSRNITN